MAIYECEIEWQANGSSPRLVNHPPTALDSDVEGLKYLDEKGKERGGIEGYPPGELARVRAEIAKGVKSGACRVVLRTSPAKMVRWNNEGWTNAKAAKKKFLVKTLISESAQKEKAKLVGYKDPNVVAI